MNFNPDHPKWQVGCCRISTTLTLLGWVEVVVSLLTLGLGLAAFRRHYVDARVEEETLLFDVSLIAMMALVALSSTLLLVGIHRRREQLLYPSLAARVLFLIFVAVFGVSTIVQPGLTQDDHYDENTATARKRWGGVKRRYSNPSTGLRLAFLIFLMVVVSLGVFCTIIWTVRCIRFIKSTRRLGERRDSVIAAGQIDAALIEAAMRRD